MNAIGRLRRSIAAGWIPSRCSGPEPEFTSRDVLCVLNAGEDFANARIDVLHDAHGKVGPYRMVMRPQRLRRVRINDLIFPEAVRLDEGLRIGVELRRAGDRAVHATGHPPTRERGLAGDRVAWMSLRGATRRGG